MNRIGIERLCVFGMPPVAFVGLAADVGASGIGIGLTPVRRYNPHAYPDWSLRDDAALRRDTRAALADRGVGITLLEGFGVAPGMAVEDYAADLDLAAELGVERINVVSMEPDMARTIASFASLTRMAGERGIAVSTEIGPGPIATLETAVAVARAVDMAGFTLLVDTMHFFRFGSTVEQLAAVPPELIGYVQLCDAPWVSPFAKYMDEAFHDRLVPGEGELPLQAVIDLLAGDVVVSLEVPRRVLAEQGIAPIERVRPCVAAARAMLAARPAR